jgi:uncharacterized cupin superfamily protein
MEVFNLYRGETEAVETPAGWHSRAAGVGERLGGSLLGMSVYDLAPGEKTWPYHFELAEEEWALVVAGEPTLRSPGGEQRLRPGDVVCFPPGPEGGHQLRNDTDAPVRVALLSGAGVQDADVCVYPETDKIKVSGPGYRRRMRLGDEVDYWEGE